MYIPLQFPSLYNGQEVFVWSDCLLDLDTDFLVKILRISYKDHVTNEEVRAEIQQAIGPHEDLLTTVKRHKLQSYGHVSRSSGLAKTILQGTVKGGRRQGRQRKR